MGKKRHPRSLRTRLLMVIILCWVVPIISVVSLAGALLRANYERSVRQELETDAANALRQVEMRFSDAFEDSKAVSYDGVVRNAYRSYQIKKDSAVLYRTVTDYLTQNFSRKENLKAVFISFWEDIGIYPYATSRGTSGYSVPRDYRRGAEGDILREMAGEDTAIRLLAYDGELYIARNLLDSRLRPYATVVLLCDCERMFQSLDTMRRISGVTMTMDGSLLLDADGSLKRLPEGEERPQGDLQFQLDEGDHTFRLDAAIGSFDVFTEMAGLRTAMGLVVLLVLPLLLAMIFLFRRHITRPVETLVDANARLEGGERGYQIRETPRSREFQKLYGQFNSMSSELKSQFERSYLEQQALQQAKVKALQSQINPHFLNNTLEIINWEARIAGNERVSAMIEALSTMLDAALDRDGRGQIHLREELSYVDAYLYIIKERLGDRLEVQRSADETMLDEMVPRLILQPLVENAVEHDITARRGGKLCVRAYREEGRMVLEVEHDGTMDGEDRETIRAILESPAAEAEGRGGPVGLRNVNQRLKLLYGDEGRLTIEETRPDTILARVSFPAGI